MWFYLSLTNQQREKFVKLIDSGRNTYRDIREEFPFLSNEDIIMLIGNKFTKRTLIDPRFLTNNLDILMFFTKCPEDFNKDYQFDNKDEFSLSVKGTNLLYQIQKEEENDRRYEEQKNLNQKIYKATIIGVIMSVLGVLISLLN